MNKPGKPGIAMELNLPPYMEARPMKRGGYTYRVQLKDGRKVNLGWNLTEALESYRLLRPAAPTSAAQLDVTTKELWVRHRKGAARRNMVFELTMDDVKQLLIDSNGKCAITGRKFSADKPEGCHIRPYAPSIDRQDSSKGYVGGNCRLVCAFVNIGMNRFGDALFQEVIDGAVRRVVREELRSKKSKSGGSYSRHRNGSI